MREKIQQCANTVVDYYREYGRHTLAWRMPEHLYPYSIAVSEVMLQQTQVLRVIDYFSKWMELFPTIEVLAVASNEEVLKAWQGLGYNNRGLRLKKLAQIVVDEYNRQFPRERKLLESLPGIGPYTAGAIRAFVWNESEVFIETNIRRVIIHHFFGDKVSVGDDEVAKVLQRLLDTEILEPREFYWALMDYGATLPKLLKANPNTRSKHYTKQSRFQGSVRQARSGIVGWLLESRSIVVSDIAEMLGIVNPNDDRIEKALHGLERDGLIVVMDDTVMLK